MFDRHLTQEEEYFANRQVETRTLRWRRCLHSGVILDQPTGQGTTVRLGVIDLPSFYADLGGPGERRSATADVARLLKKLKAEHVRGVVLDLRRNGGGSLDEAVSLTGLFIREGPVVQTGAVPRVTLTWTPTPILRCFTTGRWFC